MRKSPVTVWIDDHQIDLLKQLARKETIRRGIDTLYTDLIREAVVSFLRALTGKNEL
jgi:hypothetical protein